MLIGCSATQPHANSVSSDLIVNSEVRARLAVRPNTNRAKNVILFIGDGMGISTITAGRIFDGQSLGKPGEEHDTPLARFPNAALIKTYNTNQQVPDSAGTATAMQTGTKTRAGLIATGPDARRRNCGEALENPLTTIAELAELNGKSTGVVTTARVTHATPATAYAHLPERDWESDQYIPKEDWNLGCRDIAHQLTHFNVGDGLDVVLGGGRRSFFGEEMGGRRVSSDDNLVEEWLALGENRSYISSRAELSNVGPDEQVLGLFSDSHMTFMAERPDDSSEPTLSEMTTAAIERLNQNDQGFYLLVEGGKIDLAHHEGKAGFALLETQEFFRAIEAAMELVDVNETLVVVTADHAHVFTIAGYPTRGNPILGLVTTNDVNGEPNSEPALAGDGMPFTTLGYTNGPGAIAGKGVRDLPETGVSAMQQSVYPLKWTKIDGSFSHSETHAGEDVALFATGPWSHLFGGILEQNTIFHIMTFAFGWTDKKTQLAMEAQN